MANILKKTFPSPTREGVFTSMVVFALIVAGGVGLTLLGY